MAGMEFGPQDREGEVYSPGALCDECGHFAGRHGEDGCAGVDPKYGCRFGRGGTERHPVKCGGFKWQGQTWPRPWLAAPEGLRKSGEPA